MKRHSSSVYLATNWFLACSSKRFNLWAKFDFSLYLCKITYNSFNADQIYSKFNARILDPNRCAKFQPNWSTYMQVIVIFAKYAKKRIRRKKNKEIILKVWLLISWECLKEFFQFWNVTSPEWRYFHRKFGAIWIRRHRARDAWKSYFVIPVNILALFAYSPFSWAARHTTVCLRGYSIKVYWSFYWFLCAA